MSKQMPNGLRFVAPITIDEDSLLNWMPDKKDITQKFINLVLEPNCLTVDFSASYEHEDNWINVQRHNYIMSFLTEENSQSSIESCKQKFLKAIEDDIKSSLYCLIRDKELILAESQNKKSLLDKIDRDTFTLLFRIPPSVKELLKNAETGTNNLWADSDLLLRFYEVNRPRWPLCEANFW
jgi:hypothetical protein